MMDLGSWWILDVIGPVILLLVLIGLILNVRSDRNARLRNRFDRGGRKLHSREEKRRREGTDEF